MGGIGLGFDLLDRFRGEMENPLTMLFVAIHAACCLNVLSTSLVNGVIICLWIALEKCWQCGGKLDACTLADSSVLTISGSGCRVLRAKLMYCGMPGFSCDMAAVIETGLLAK